MPLTQLPAFAGLAQTARFLIPLRAFSDPDCNIPICPPESPTCEGFSFTLTTYTDAKSIYLEDFLIYY